MDIPGTFKFIKLPGKFLLQPFNQVLDDSLHAKCDIGTLNAGTSEAIHFQGFSLAIKKYV